MKKGLFILLFFMGLLFSQEIKLEEVYTLGEDDFFGEIDEVRVINGHLYILDGPEYALHKYSLNGELLKTVGREGKGPGEFSGNLCNVRLVKDTIVVNSIIVGGGFFTYFDQDLNFIRSELISPNNPT